MKEKDLFELVNPLRTTTWRRSKHYPEINEENYRKYYIAAQSLGLRRRDERYDFIIGIYSLIRRHSFPDTYWETGAKKAVTYRCNRIDENINYFLGQCEKAMIIKWLYEIYDYRDYQTVGYLKAYSNEEAKQLASLMFEPMIKNIGGSLGWGKVTPLWKNDFEESEKLYTKLCIKAMKEVDKSVQNRKDSINKLEKEIKNYYLIKDFLNLNMSTFSET